MSLGLTYKTEPRTFLAYTLDDMLDLARRTERLLERAGTSTETDDTKGRSLWPADR